MSTITAEHGPHPRSRLDAADEEKITREIAPGRHTLRANNTLMWKTIEFDAPPGAHVHFTCINRAPRGLYYMLAIFGVAPLLVTLRSGRPDESA